MLSDALIAIGSAIVSSAGMAVLVKGWTERRLTAATVADKLSDTALDLLHQAKQDADDARKEAREARREANEARREAVVARTEAMRAAATVRHMVTAILDPYATLEELRRMVQEDDGRPRR